MDDTTIAAIATPFAAAGGIGIIRISGQSAYDVAGRIYCRARDFCSGPATTIGAGIANLTANNLYHGYITDGPKIIDEVMLVKMPGPHSYTGEDVVEIHAHGGRYVLKTILSLVIKSGCRHAEPGEFTRRAFIHGRIDLSQAEAVADIIEASTDVALGAAADQMAGKLKAEVSGVRRLLLSSLAELDAAIDFADQAEGDEEGRHLAAYLEKQAIPAIDELINRHDTSWHLSNGVRVAIAGAPNVGKSTLLNMLVNADRAIVSEVPGTTRDLIECTVFEKGVPFVFVDTAGIRVDAGDRVEAMGMDRALDALNQADVVLFLVDATTGITAADQSICARLEGRPAICAANKTDIPGANGFAFPSAWRQRFPGLRISAKTGQGIPEMKQALLAAVSGAPDESQAPFHGAIPNLRHRDALARARGSAVAALTSLKEGIPTDLVAIDIRDAVNALGEITGESVGEDVLEAIFGRFCVGK